MDEQLLKRAKSVLMNTYNRAEINIVYAEGAMVRDDEGKEYIDLFAGVAVNNLGHRHPRVIAAIESQLEKAAHVSNLFYHQPMIDLAERLVRLSGLNKVFFCNSGAEANEVAIKIARKYGHNKGIDNPEIISTHNSFHGRTMGALAATGQPKYHKPFAPMLPGFVFADFNDTKSIEALINNNTVAVLLEPIQAEGGLIFPQGDFLLEVQKLCNKHDILFILDEVQTCMGRTGKFLAKEHWGLSPDVLTLAKGIGGGMPIGAALVNEKADILVPGDHGCTFGGNPAICAGAIAAIDELMENLLSIVPSKNAIIQNWLDEMKKKGKVLDYHLMGLFSAVKIDPEKAKTIVKEGLSKGLLLNVVGGNVLRVAPPLVIKDDELREGLKRLEGLL
jgi:acetylornithine/N-succinyldiaminopimelate aminotransferase